jgi:heterodisulfide reductase subunit C
MDHGPQRLFAMVRAGMRDAVLRSNTPWMCIACQTCVVRCPQKVQIPEVMLGLKALAEREGMVRSSTAIDFSRTFVNNIHRFGRSYEVGLVAWHYLRHYPMRLPAMAPVGIGMLAKGRMRMRVHRIRGRRELRAILARATELEAAS